eukprot:3127297-Rhodomonas_salina.2
MSGAFSSTFSTFNTARRSAVLSSAKSTPNSRFPGTNCTGKAVDSAGGAMSSTEIAHDAAAPCAVRAATPR